jgi:hypothetical protein
MIEDNKIFKLNDLSIESTPEERVAWIKGLNASGYAGCNRKGTICDRREFPDAVEIQPNSMFGIVKPKKLK